MQMRHVLINESITYKGVITPCSPIEKAMGQITGNGKNELQVPLGEKVEPPAKKAIWTDNQTEDSGPRGKPKLSVVTKPSLEPAA